MVKRYFRISGIKYLDCNDSEQDFKAWEYMLQETVNDLDLFKDLLWLRNGKVKLTREGKLDFYYHVGGLMGEGEQEYIKSIKVAMYKTYGDRLVDLLKQASKFIKEIPVGTADNKPCAAEMTPADCLDREKKFNLKLKVF